MIEIEHLPDARWANPAQMYGPAAPVLWRYT